MWNTHTHVKGANQYKTCKLRIYSNKHRDRNIILTCILIYLIKQKKRDTYLLRHFRIDQV
jgi:hypothetical protein